MYFTCKIHVKYMPDKYASPLAYLSGPAKVKAQPQRAKSTQGSVLEFIKSHGFQLTVVHFFPEEENWYPPEN